MYWKSEENPQLELENAFYSHQTQPELIVWKASPSLTHLRSTKHFPPFSLWETHGYNIATDSSHIGFTLDRIQADADMECPVFTSNLTGDI